MNYRDPALRTCPGCRGPARTDSTECPNCNHQFTLTYRTAP